MSNLDIKQCFLVNNDCYKQGRKIRPMGIIVHSTGANNPFIKRYVQPDDGILGVNANKNDWNRRGVSKCVHAFIGKDKDGNVRIYQTLPWDYRCWGCGSGKKGSYNNNYIQFEICEDALNDEKYFNEAFALAIKLCIYLCDKYGIFTHNVISHREACLRGYASNHGDCDHWLNRFDKNMDWFRSQIEDKDDKTTSSQNSASTPLSPTAISEIYEVKSGDSLAKIAQKTGVPWKTIAELNGIKFPYVIKKGQILKLSGKAPDKSFKVKLKDNMTIRKTPMVSSDNIVKKDGAKKGMVYTIVETNGTWGLLKSYSKQRNGWINISDKYVQRL